MLDFHFDVVAQDSQVPVLQCSCQNEMLHSIWFRSEVQNGYGCPLQFSISVDDEPVLSGCSGMMTILGLLTCCTSPEKVASSVLELQGFSVTLWSRAEWREGFYLKAHSAEPATVPWGNSGTASEYVLMFFGILYRERIWIIPNLDRTCYQFWIDFESF